MWESGLTQPPPIGAASGKQHRPERRGLPPARPQPTASGHRNDRSDEEEYARFGHRCRRRHGPITAAVVDIGSRNGHEVEDVSHRVVVEVSLVPDRGLPGAVATRPVDLDEVENVYVAVEIGVARGRELHRGDPRMIEQIANAAGTTHGGCSGGRHNPGRPIPATVLPARQEGRPQTRRGRPAGRN